jgi:hypothetical protein
MQVHAQVRTWSPANKWQRFQKKKKIKNLSQMISPVQKQGFLNVTEPAPVDGTNEASTNGYENNASSTNNANQ